MLSVTPKVNIHLFSNVWYICSWTGCFPQCLVESMLAFLNTALTGVRKASVAYAKIRIAFSSKTVGFLCSLSGYA